EVAYGWRAALTRKQGPTMLVLTRQGLPIVDRKELASAAGVLKGAYVLAKEKGDSPDIILIASGSEVQIVLEAQKKLVEEGIDARVISMPSWALFQEQSQQYRDQVLPPNVKARLAVEAGSPFGWREWVEDAGDVIGISKFGASAPWQELFKQYGLTVDNVVEKARQLLG
ncbi:MAG: transketolase C-terminal domain-containing protein, partial [bacterium]